MDLRPAAGVTILVFCTEAAHTLLYIPLLQSYLAGSLHWTPAFPGYALTAFGVTRLVTQVPAGRGVDRVGPRLGSLAGLGLLLLAGALFAVVRIPLVFLGVACLYGVGSALLWPAIFTVAAGSYVEEHRGRLATAIQLAEAIGVGVGAGAGSLLVDRFGSGAGFACYLGLIGLGLVLVLSARSRWLVQAAQSKPGWDLRSALRTPVPLNLALLGLTGALLTLAPNLLTPILRIYAIQNLGLHLHDLIPPLIPVAVIGGLAMVGSGAVSDRIGRTPVILVGLCTGAVGLWFVGASHALLPAVIAAGTGVAGYVATQPSWSAAIFDASVAEHRGAQFALIMVVQGLAEAMAPAIGGKVAETFDPGATFQLAGLMLALAALVTAGQLFLARQRRAIIRN